MRKSILTAAVAFFIIATSFTGKYMTKNGKVSFYSDAPMEKIEAKNSQVNAAIDTESGSVLYKVLIKSFIFEKALMQEHFNENYMESDKFPTAMFKGTITNLKEINFEKDGKYTAKVSGDMTIHGVTKKITSDGSITVKGKTIHVQSKFKVKLADYNISIPGAVTGKIAEQVEITVDSELTAVEK